jgi:hypothetical protein
LSVRYKAFRHFDKINIFHRQGSIPDHLSRAVRCQATADCGSTCKSQLPLCHLYAFLSAAPLGAFTSFFQLSAFTQLPAMKGGRGTPGELMNASIATQNFRYEILPDVRLCTLCAPHSLLLYQLTLFRWSCSVLLFRPVKQILHETSFNSVLTSKTRPPKAVF